MKTEKYSTEEEAKDRANELTITSDPDYFCPLINRLCVKNCICISPPVHRASGSAYDKDTYWHVYSWSCDNAMFFGGDR